jgi:hypothetical protein
MLKRPLFTSFLLLISSLGHAKFSDVKPCLSDHIYEALTLNQERMPLYSELSQGRSKVVSDRLISMERKLSLKTPLADAVAVPFQLAGVRILCDDLIDMAKVPNFKASNGKDSLENFRAPNISEIHSRLKELYRNQDMAGVFAYTDHLVEEELNVPRYNCLVRHMLESIRRVAALAPIHNQKALEKLNTSSLFLSWGAIKTHIGLLVESAEIDKLAAPLQADGLPIICQDVPFIPVP